MSGTYLDDTYLDESRVTGAKRTPAPRRRSASGYGRKLPTSWMLEVDGRWRRVYVMQWSNAGSAYVVVGGEELFLPFSDLQYVADKLDEKRRRS